MLPGDEAESVEHADSSCVGGTEASPTPSVTPPQSTSSLDAQDGPDDNGQGQYLMTDHGGTKPEDADLSGTQDLQDPIETPA